MYRRICRLYVNMPFHIMYQSILGFGDPRNAHFSLHYWFSNLGVGENGCSNTKGSSTPISISTRSSDILSVLHSGLKCNNLFFNWSRPPVPYSYEFTVIIFPHTKQRTVHKITYDHTKQRLSFLHKRLQQFINYIFLGYTTHMTSF